MAGAGFGKTAIVEELVEFSSFGECRNNLVMEYLSGGYSFVYYYIIRQHM